MRNKFLQQDLKLKKDQFFFISISLILLFFVTLNLTSCSNGSSSPEPTVTTDCVNNPGLCNGTIYQNYQGFMPYNYYNNSPFYNVNNSSYLCQCPAGYIPTYNNIGGLGCVQNYNMTPQYSYLYWGFGVNNNQWVNLPQISNIEGYYGAQTYTSQNSCYNGVVQSCFVNQVNTCSAGYTCVATQAASALGLCVSNSSNNIIFR